MEASLAGDSLDGDILRLLLPAILAVFLDPAMALIDTGRANVCADAHAGCLLPSWHMKKLDFMSALRVHC
jgi:hypothetical protein